MLSAEEQLRIIKSGAANIVPEEGLLKKLKRGEPLNIKLGVDPTSPDLHLGHAVPLRKMRQFQDLGHRVTLIIGNGTALIGDPSGKNTTRPQLTSEQIEANAKTYVEQAFNVLDPEKTTVVYNADWILKLDLKGLLELCSKFTVARILERDDFTKRYQSHTPIALHEFLYPVMQAYDSVVIKADVEMGGNDQLFNLLAGRELMEKMGMEPQVALTMPLLEGTDGVLKMSKSYGNYVGLTDEPADMFGKVMSIPDELMPRYYRLASTLSVDEVDEIERGLANNELHPNKVKRALARNIVTLYHDEAAAAAAEEQFDRVFKQHEAPEDIPEFAADLTPNDDGKVYLAKLLHDAGMAPSIGEARRLIDGGGVKINGESVAPKQYNVDPAELAGATLQVGKRKFVKLS
ncbi:MAG TPA: tyrosine--tRNA ligase [Candidatus Aphodovivens excrementavium]|nr:tyrosine--tRNA ligase [Candidatus Aphodovivens excrementavium]